MILPNELDVTLTVCRNGMPLLEVANLPGAFAEMRPAQARALAAALIEAARMADVEPSRNLARMRHVAIKMEVLP